MCESELCLLRPGDLRVLPLVFSVLSALRYITMFEQLYGADSGPAAVAETGVNIHSLSVQPIQEADFPYFNRNAALLPSEWFHLTC